MTIETYEKARELMMNIDYIKEEVETLEEIKIKIERNKKGEEAYIIISDRNDEVDIEFNDIKLALVNLTIEEYNKKLSQLIHEFENL